MRDFLEDDIDALESDLLNFCGHSVSHYYQILASTTRKESKIYKNIKFDSGMTKHGRLILIDEGKRVINLGDKPVDIYAVIVLFEDKCRFMHAHINKNRWKMFWANMDDGLSADEIAERCIRKIFLGERNLLY